MIKKYLEQKERELNCLHQERAFLYLAREVLEKLEQEINCEVTYISLNVWERLKGRVFFSFLDEKLTPDEKIDRIIEVAERMEFAPFVYSYGYQETPTFYCESFRKVKIRDYSIQLVFILGRQVPTGYSVKCEETTETVVTKKYNVECAINGGKIK